jgi:uncharacterized protein (TIGR02118 family)
MTKAVVIISRRQDFSAEKFRDYWLSEHAQLASRLPGLVRYVQDHIGRLEQQGSRPCDGLEEFEFESPEAMETALASEQGAAALADLQNFSDMTRSGLVYVEEVPVELKSRAPHY